MICCTQEIYDLKYAGCDRIRLIIDEFHYIFSENERSRAYIDGLRKTHPAVPILVMSATFGQPEEIRGYLERVMERDFELYLLKERTTRLTYLSHALSAREIHDALVFAFSQKGVHQVADLIAAQRMDIDKDRKARLRDLAWILEVNVVQKHLYKGVGVYYGRLLPKEKLLVERAYRERIIDVVVGTDALALGVNLPAETVVFAQTVKYFDRRPLTKTSFSQMAGRAGRKGLFDEGFVSWLADSPVESRGVDTGEMFKALERTGDEKATIELCPDFGAILKNAAPSKTKPISSLATRCPSSAPRPCSKRFATPCARSIPASACWLPGARKCSSASSPTCGTARWRSTRIWKWPICSFAAPAAAKSTSTPTA